VPLEVAAVEVTAAAKHSNQSIMAALEMAAVVAVRWQQWWQ